MNRFFALMLTLPVLLMPVAGSAAKLSCSIHPPRGTSHTGLAPLAKIPKEEAQNKAMSAVDSASSAEEGKLEVERGCLVYSFDVKSPKTSGAQEVLVDAGNGNILSQKHEGRLKEAAERVFHHDSAKKTY
jgi:hypothetical protein